MEPPPNIRHLLSLSKIYLFIDLNFAVYLEQMYFGSEDNLSRPGHNVCPLSIRAMIHIALWSSVNVKMLLQLLQP